MDEKTSDKLADWRDCERALIAATEDETITPEVANVMYQAATYLRQAADEAAQPAQAAQPSADAEDANDRAYVRNVLAECLSDYSAPNFTDRHDTASRLRLAIEIVDAARAAEGDGNAT